MFRRLVKFWNEDRSLTALLIYLIIEIFIVPPLLKDSLWQPILQTFFFSLILLSGVFSVATYRYQYLITLVLAVVTFLIQMIALLSPSEGMLLARLSSSILFLSVLAALVLVRIFKEGDINFHRIRGGIAVYLIIGTVWANGYYLVYLANPGNSFAGTIAAAAAETITRWEFLYFSFITLTTLGYGDVLPVSPIAQTLTMAEGLIGQLLPVILIARLVSLEIEHRRSRKAASH